MTIRWFLASAGPALALCACSSSTDELPALQLGAVVPGVVQGGDVAVQWTVSGAGFRQGATLSVDAPGVTIANVTVVRSDRITFELSAANTLVAGSTELTVTNPDMSSLSTPVPTIPESVTLSGSVQPVLDSHCIGCHFGGAPAGALVLTAGVTHGSTVGVPSTGFPTLDLIDPGSPESSYLVDKISGVAAVGAVMPPNGGPLTATEIALVVAWARAGALDD